jgi:hypothetical protein
MMLQLDTLRHYLALVLRGSRLVDNFIKAFSAIGRGDAIYAWWCVQASISIVCVLCCVVPRLQHHGHTLISGSGDRLYEPRFLLSIAKMTLAA